MNASLSLTPFSALIFAGAGQGMVLSAALFRAKEPRPGNRALARLLLLLSATLVLGFLVSGNELPSPYLYRVPTAFNFLFGPFLYFYIRDLLQRPARRSDLWHYLPFVLCLLYLVPVFMLDPVRKAELFRHDGHSPSGRIMGVLHCLSILSYSFYCRFYLLQANLEDGDGRHAAWVSLLVNAYLGFGAFALVQQLSPVRLAPLWLVPVGAACIILALGYLGVIAPQARERNEGNRARKVGLRPESIPAYRSELVRLMEDEKLFLDGSLSLSKLAKKMGIASGQLSLLLNDHMSQKFFDFVNFYRVKEAKRLLEEAACRQINVLELGFEVGFNSKSTFYSAFRKFEGCTPLVYLENQS